MSGSILDRSTRVAVEAATSPARIVLAHDWLCGVRGGEMVLERIARVVGERHRVTALYTMFDGGTSIGRAVDALPRRVSAVGRVPGAARARRWLLPAWPRAVAQLSQMLGRDHAGEPVDLLVSTSSAAVKGMRAPDGVGHLCYCHTPARYVWSQSGEYKGGARSLGLVLAGPVFKRWDRRTASNVTRFVANSSATAELIGRCFNREAEVVHPPVRTGYFTPDAGEKREDFWLVVSALEPYKRVDLAIDAAKLVGAPLVIAGTGSQGKTLRARAGRHARFLGRVSDEELRGLYRRAELLVFPQVEDFGIVAVEAQACGCPVVARRAGGALESVVAGRTGAFFDAPEARELAKATRDVPAGCARACRENALRFGEELFDARMLRLIERELGREDPLHHTR